MTFGEMRQIIEEEEKEKELSEKNNSEKGKSERKRKMETRGGGANNKTPKSIATTPQKKGSCFKKRSN